ncbi:MAG: DNA/RNA non-specific endonuclease [Spirochaetota bacterium]
MQNQAVRRETRYGTPAADQVVHNRDYVLGYSYYFRQAKWALEIVDLANTSIEDMQARELVERADNFRPDYRIPSRFRADLADYRRSGYDRGHLICSANKRFTKLQNSETFLLSNMAPQAPRLNRDVWRILEERIREYDGRDEIYETFVMCGPIFYFDQEVVVIGGKDENDVTIPVPHAFFKSVLSEDYRGNLAMWSFLLPNDPDQEEWEPLEHYLVSTRTIEKLGGIFLWQGLVGPEMDEMKQSIARAWWDS